MSLKNHSNPDLVEGKDYIINKNGLMEFLSAYHLKRGYCCGSSCKNCPFNYINVKDQKK